MTTRCPGPECTSRAAKAGLCATHYQQRRRTGQLWAIRTEAAVQVSLRLPASTVAQLRRMARGRRVSVYLLACQLLAAAVRGA